MEIIATLERLDEKLAECQAAKSDAELRSVFPTFCMAPRAVGKDPFSEEYLAEQMSFYHHLAGRKYETVNETIKLDVDKFSKNPFPYSSGSPQVVGDQLLSIGSLIRRMNVPIGARVLEFGPGWGNTTIAMAMAGMQVTAVDIGADFCELIQRRAQTQGVSIDVVNGDFMYAETVTEPYDAVVFFECFHHCADHMRLLKALHTALKPGGKIYFGGEPITDAFPMPWGLRSDGESLWAIRSNGWLELGFTEAYFVEALSRTGWTGIKHQSNDYFGANVWEAVKDETRVVETPSPEVLALRTEINELRTTTRTQAAQLSEQTSQIARQHESLSRHASLVEAFRNSSSWKITAPIRAAVKLFRR